MFVFLKALFYIRGVTCIDALWLVSTLCDILCYNPHARVRGELEPVIFRV